MKACLIRQPAGLGDILFSLKIARTMIDRGYYVIWPVIPHYSFISEYIKIDKLVFVDETKHFPFKDIYSRSMLVPPREDFVFIPIQIADQIYPQLPILGSKYKLAGMSYDSWPDSVEFIRDRTKEESLYYDVLRLKDDEEYTLTSWIYGSPPNSKVLHGAKPINKYDRVINLEYIGGYSPFDWSLVFERASEIHTVDTCFICILETLSTKAKKKNMYSRRKYNDFIYQISPYFNGSWAYLDIHAQRRDIL